MKNYNKLHIENDKIKEATQFLFQYKHRPHIFSYHKYGIYLKPYQYPLTEGVEFTCEHILGLLKKTVQNIL